MEPIQAQVTASPIFETKNPMTFQLAPRNPRNHTGGIRRLQRPLLSYPANTQLQQELQTLMQDFMLQYQDTRPPSPHNRQHRESIPPPVPMWPCICSTMRRATSSSTAISWNTLSTRLYGPVIWYRDPSRHDHGRKENIPDYRKGDKTYARMQCGTANAHCTKHHQILPPLKQTPGPIKLVHCMRVSWRQEGQLQNTCHNERKSTFPVTVEHQLQTSLQ